MTATVAELETQYSSVQQHCVLLLLVSKVTSYGLDNWSMIPGRGTI